LRTRICLLLLLTSTGAAGAPPTKICAVYTSITSFASRAALDQAAGAQPPFLMEKHKRAMAGANNDGAAQAVADAGFNTLFMTIYPLWGKNWWEIPAARGLIKDALVQAHGHVRVHLGLSLFNTQFCEDPSRYPGASRTIQCDGTRPSWVCFFDDRLWETFIRNAMEMARIGKEVPDTMDGIFLDPEAYGPECYLCFCDNCVRKFNAFAGQSMPAGLVKPDGWLLARGLWKAYAVDWHDAEVRRHAMALRHAVHAIDPALQLSSLLWDYPVAVGIGDARQGYFRNLAIGLGMRQKPAWTCPEHTYYSDAGDLHRIIEQVRADLTAAGAADVVKIFPGIRVLRQPAVTLIDRAKVIHDADVPGYWMYEWDDLRWKRPIDFEGALVDEPAAYLKAFAEANRIVLHAAEGERK
jgi:hypothetical protein